MVNELGQSLTAELRFRQNFTFRSDASSWHDKPSIIHLGLQDCLEPTGPALLLSWEFYSPWHFACTTSFATDTRPGRGRYDLQVRLLLRALGTVLGTCLLPAVNARRIQGSTYSVVTHTRQIFYPAATDQDHAVLLQVVAFTTNVGSHFVAIGQAYTADLPQSRVRLLRRGCVDTGANAAALRASLERGYVALGHFALTRFAY